MRQREAHPRDARAVLTDELDGRNLAHPNALRPDIAVDVQARRIGELGGVEGSKAAEIAHAVSKFKGHPIAGSVGLGAKLALRGDYAINKAARALGKPSDLQYVGKVLEGMKSGLPLAAAVTAARASQLPDDE